MKNKKEVYVHVDTPKKAKKLKKVLDMFNEKVYEDRVWYDDGYPYYATDDDRDYWVGDSLKDSEDLKNKTEVSIKELKNILAVENLKEGDVVVFKGGFLGKIVGFKVDSEIVVNDEDNDNVTCFVWDFIRYATEEEKQLLNPKKELEVGKWYKTGRTLFNHQSGYNSYGFLHNNWNLNDWRTNLDDFEFVTPIEANPQEVEQKLIEEAKRTGHTYSEYDYNPEENELCGINDGRLESVFCDGHWEQPTDKFAELKEAYNNGYCVEFYDGKTDTWKRHENPCWNPELQWRIMVNNGHLVVSDVYLLNQIKELKKSIEKIKSNIK